MSGRYNATSYLRKSTSSLTTKTQGQQGKITKELPTSSISNQNSTRKSMDRNSSASEKVKHAATIQQLVEKAAMVEPHVISVNNKPQQLPVVLPYVELGHEPNSKKRKNQSNQSSPSANEDNNSNTDIEETMEDDEVEDKEDPSFTLVQSREKNVRLQTQAPNKRIENNSSNNNNRNTRAHAQPNKDRLPAIYLRMSGASTATYNNSNIISNHNELMRNFPTHDLSKIKFMKFASFDSTLLVIATDDLTTHTLLNTTSNWKTDAFGRGLKSRRHTPSAVQTGAPSTYTFSIARVSRELNVEDPAVLATFKELGFNKVVRSVNSKDNTPTTFLRLYTESKEIYAKHMYRKEPVLLYFSPFYAITETRPLQCHNCQGLGHIAFNCPKEEPVCLICSGPHRVKQCTQPEKKHCANCDSTEHISCARQCKKMQEHVIEKEKLQAQKAAPRQQHQQQHKQQQQQKNSTGQQPTTQKQQKQQQKPPKQTYSSILQGNALAEIKVRKTLAEKNLQQLQQQHQELEMKFEGLKTVLTDLLAVFKLYLPSNLHESAMSRINSRLESTSVTSPMTHDE